jgi:hypothetical protein
MMVKDREGDLTLMQREDIERLASIHEPSCISIYIPVHSTGFEGQTNPIRLKNAIREAERALEATGMRRPDVESLLEPAREFLATEGPWCYWQGGLAMFRSETTFEVYNMPIDFDEHVRVAGRFYIKPLIPALIADGMFYVLCVSQNATRVLSCTRETATPVEIEALPGSLADALGYETTEDHIEYHAGAAGKDGGAPVYHGQGAGSDDKRQDLKRYLRIIGDAVDDALNGHKEPLVFVGAEPLHAIYTDISDYPHLTGDGVAGNFEHASDEEIRDRAWEIVEPVFSEGQQKARSEYERLGGTERAVTAIEDIVRAAHDGRIAMLFIDAKASLWGTYNPATRQVAIHAEPADEDDELLDLCAVKTLLTDGAVHAPDADDIPGGGPAAAVLRY